MTPDQYCQDKTIKSGSSFYFSYLFLPESQRRAMYALYAFCREVDDVVDECRDPAIARVKLQWWRDEVARIYANSPQHPVGQALNTVLAHFDLPQEYFLEIIDGMEMDLHQNRYRNFSDLGLYCYRVAGVVGLLSTEIFGYEDRRTPRYATDLGLAFQLTNILRDVREDALRDRIYLPLDELQRFGVSESDILTSQENDNTRALFAFQAERALQYYDSAMEKLPESERYNQRSALIMAGIYRQTLNRIMELDYPIFSRRVSLPPWNKLWLAWRTARREQSRLNRSGKRG
ncbi:MAG: presqualene diphosphate synthase HpnD [Gammaproteobacteria bacterium]|nr:presqualene diphosphate synthase HpnD [Gammaproteobacteria bacterium]